MTLRAEYHGSCSRCGGEIEPGNPIQPAQQGDGWEHDDCEAAPTEDRDAKREVCMVCWLLKPCACE